MADKAAPFRAACLGVSHLQEHGEVVRRVALTCKEDVPQ